MKTIASYPLKVEGEQVVEMPQGAQILSVVVFGGAPTIFAAVDTAKKKEKRTFVCLGTGHPAPDLTGLHFLASLRHVGRNQQGAAETFVWHFFERKSA